MHFKLIPMLEKLKHFKENHPFTSLMLIAIAVRIIVVICDLTSNKQNAWLLALIPTFSIIMPAFGIIENASAFLGIPLLLYGANVVLRQEVLRQNNLTENVHRTSFLIAGLMMGLGICVWYESAFIVLSILILLLVRRNPKGALMTLIGIVIAIVAVGLLLWALSVNPLKYIQL